MRVKLLPLLLQRRRRRLLLPSRRKSWNLPRLRIVRKYCICNTKIAVVTLVCELCIDVKERVKDIDHPEVAFAYPDSNSFMCPYSKTSLSVAGTTATKKADVVVASQPVMGNAPMTVDLALAVVKKLRRKVGEATTGALRRSTPRRPRGL
jgi:hypothetical protein